MRDIKPSNLLLAPTADGAFTCVLSDLTISRFAKAMLGESWMSLSVGDAAAAYLAPEQWDSQLFGGLTVKADSWALAATMVHMATGKAPWEGCSLKQVWAALFAWLLNASSGA